MEVLEGFDPDSHRIKIHLKKLLHLHLEQEKLTLSSLILPAFIENLPNK